MKRNKYLIIVAILMSACISSCSSKVEKNELFNDEIFNSVVERAESIKKYQIGYPVNVNFDLEDFYNWYNENKLSKVLLNDVGDPNDETTTDHGAINVEREVIKKFSSLYGFDENDVWGLVSASGTDGNNHGIYFGRKYLEYKTQLKPILYVSTESHYSNMRLAELQQLDIKLIPTDDMGRMIPEEFRKVLDNTRPALIVFSMGTTFKGGIDDQQAINKIVEEMKPPAVYRHVDAALFGGYLAFSDDNKLIDKKVCGYDSIAISGHKYFGIDEPCGLFLTTKEIIKHQDQYNILYLNRSMPMINCSRSATNPLKFYYVMKKYGVDGFKKQTKQMLENTAYLKNKLDEIGWSSWVSCKESNTIFFKRPDDSVMKKYYLAADYDERFGGDLAHIVVMQSVTKDLIDEFVKDIGKKK